MDDKSWNDYLTGVNTGVAFGPLGELGKSHRWEPAAPPPIPVPEQRSVEPAGIPRAEPRDPQSPTGPSHSKPETWWGALRDFDLHTHLVAKGRKALNPIAESRAFRASLCLLALIGGLYGYFGIEGQAAPWLGAIAFAMLAIVAPFAAGIAILMTLYIIGAALSLTVGVAIVAFWVGLIGGAGLLGVVIVRALIRF